MGDVAVNLVAVFCVDGVMGMPRARAYIGRDGKIHHYNEPLADAHKTAIRWAYRAATTLREPLSGPVAVEVVSQRQLPKSKPKRVESEPDCFKPDADNVMKLVLDALNTFAWNDDSQVVDAHARKLPRRRNVTDRTYVKIYALEEGQ